jgi:hypothetical protein
MAMTIAAFAIGCDASDQRLPAKKQRAETSCDLFRAVNGSPADNLTKVIELMGGIQKIIGPDDIVVIKPNVQWWNQGVPNLSAMKRLVDLIMSRSGGFGGEVVLAENCHRGSRPWEHKSSGWVPRFVRNSDLDNIYNYGDLSSDLKRRYGDKFSTCHWINAKSGGRRAYGPADGPGYVFCDGTGGVPLISYDNGLEGDDLRAVIMTYPIFQTDRGTLIDFKNGIWEKGAYTHQPMKFINFAALNHHSTYCGITGAVKNYLGVTDLSGGPDPYDDGKLTEGYYNFHSFPFDKWAPGPKPGMIGAEIGVFLSTIRKADLNIVAAEWVGLASRTEPPAARTRAVLACKDPVALDFHSAKYILYPNSKISYHAPDDENSPTYQYLKACSEAGGGELDESCVDVHAYDFKAGALQDNDNLVVIGETQWGWNAKMILKYLVLRTGLMA